MDLDYEKNLGDTERVIRASVGAGLVGLVATKKATGPWAVISSVTAMSQFIEAYLAY